MQSRFALTLSLFSITLLTVPAHASDSGHYSPKRYDYGQSIFADSAILALALLPEFDHTPGAFSALIHNYNSNIILPDTVTVDLRGMNEPGQSLTIETIDSDYAEIAKHTPDSTAVRPGFFGRIGNYFKNSNQDKTLYKKFDFSIIGGPHYSSDVGFGLGLVAAGLYRLDRKDFFIPPSNISLYGDVTTSGFYLVGIRGNTFIEGAKYRVDYMAFFSSMPTDFWGMGYDRGENDDHIKFTQKRVHFQADMMYRPARNFYVGVKLYLNRTAARNVKDPGDYAYFDGQKDMYLSFGAGLFLLYDSRDVITNPYRGWYMRLENTVYPTFFGNKPDFNLVELTVDYYHSPWKNAVLAYDLHGVLGTGDVPWTMLPRMGGVYRMRGYYEGRYRDRGLLEVQAELRQRVWRRIGAVAWVGAGNVFNSPSDFRIKNTLPNYGVGFRWEFKNRVNVRLDYGLGKRGHSGFIFNINEAF